MLSANKRNLSGYKQSGVVSGKYWVAGGISMFVMCVEKMKKSVLSH
jgi:hypothetical protein